MYYRMNDFQVEELEAQLKSLGFRLDGYSRVVAEKEPSPIGWKWIWVGFAVSLIPNYGFVSIVFFLWAFLGVIESIVSLAIRFIHRHKIEDIELRLAKRKMALFGKYKDFVINESEVIYAAVQAIESKPCLNDDQIEFSLDPESYKELTIEKFSPQNCYTEAIDGELLVQRDEEGKISLIEILVCLNVLTGDKDYDLCEELFPHFQDYNTVCRSIIELKRKRNIEFDMLSQSFQKARRLKVEEHKLVSNS